MYQNEEKPPIQRTTHHQHITPLSLLLPNASLPKKPPILPIPPQPLSFIFNQLIGRSKSLFLLLLICFVVTDISFQSGVGMGICGSS